MAQHNWVGQTLGGRYKIEGTLGKGGMSAVYKATDPNLRRTVAVKMIHPHLSDNPDFVVRFKEEAAAVAQLRHPNIVQVFDFNNDDETYYMVLEFVPGETLQARLKRLNDAGRRLSMTEAIKFAMQICDAADYAHQRGLIHRDIKPANIMLDVYGKAVLMDFGIAKIVGGQHKTATGATVGTALYMSPEQIRGERVDERSDIYSIGVALFEMVNGRPPYEADSALTLMMMHINDPVPDLRQIWPDTPDDLVTVIEKALAKNRTERFQSAAEMAAILRKINERLQGPAAGVTMIEEALPEEPLSAATILEPAPVDAAPVTTTPVGSAEAIFPEEMPTVKPQRATAGLAADRMKPPVAGVSPAGASPAQIPSVAPKVELPAGQRGVPGAKRRFSPALVAGGVAGLVALLVLAFVIGAQFSGSGDDTVGLSQDMTKTAAALAQSATSTPEASATRAQDATNTAIALAAAVSPTLEPSATTAPTSTAEPSPTATSAPTETSAPTSEPTATVAATATEEPTTATVPPTETSVPAAVPTDTPLPSPYYVRITRITLTDNVYVVDYETIGFTESLQGWHIHFFFNTVAPEQAGVPGAGPWILYYGPTPFTQYGAYDRPAAATQMCARIANADHTLYTFSGTLDTGNCVDLPGL